MSVSIVVPASLSNLGPGFDVLGMALDLHNTFDLAPRGARGDDRADGVRVEASEHLLLRTMRAAEGAFGEQIPHGVDLVSHDRVPWSRGLGSSATARVAGVIAWCHFTGLRPPVDELMDFLARQEGHPDNVVAAFLGGVTLATRTQRALCTRSFQPPLGMRVALCIPAVEVSTQVARGVLPVTYPRSDVVFTSGRLAFLLFGLMRADADALRLGEEDVVHHPYRKGLIGPVDEALAAAHEAGAAAAFISGSGSTLAALVLDEAVDAHAVARALARPFDRQGVQADTRVVAPDVRGAWQRFLDAAA